MIAVLVIAIEWLSIAATALLGLAGLLWDPTWFTLACVALATAGAARHLSTTDDRIRDRHPGGRR